MKDFAIVLNKKSKNANFISDYIKVFRKEKLQYYLYKVEPEKLTATLNKCVKNYSLILIAGGDGSVRSAAQACLGRSVTLGILPLGTLNHFSKDLDLPVTPEEISEAIHHKKTTYVDLAKVNEHIFANNCSIGFYPKFVKHREIYSHVFNKWFSYFPSLLKSFSERKYQKFRLITKSFKKIISTPFFMISNNLYEYEFPINIKRKSLTKGFLGIYYLSSENANKGNFLSKIFGRKKQLTVKKTKGKVHLEFSKKKIFVALDGDRYMVETPLSYKILPKALKILIKKK